MLRWLRLLVRVRHAEAVEITDRHVIVLTTIDGYDPPTDEDVDALGKVFAPARVVCLSGVALKAIRRLD